MSEFSQDDLNAFFKGKLENADPDGNMWNVPPDFVFDNAINKVNAQNTQAQTNNRKLLLLLLIPLVFLTGIIINSQLNLNDINNKVRLLENKVIHSDQQIVELKTKIDAQKDEFVKQLNSNTEEIKESIKNETRKIFNSQRKKILRSNNNSSKSKVAGLFSQSRNSSKSNSNPSVVFSEGTNSEFVKNGNVNKNADQLLNTNSDFSNDDLNKNVPPLSKIYFLPSLGLHNSIGLFTRDLKSKVPDLIDHKGVNSGTDDLTSVVSYGLSTRQNFSSLSMSEMNNTLISYDNNYSGFGFSLHAQKSISPKFDMIFSLGYDLYNNRSENTGISLYNTNNESETSNGDINYMLDVETETPFGAVNSITNFEVAENVNADFDVLNQKTETAQSLNVLSINVGPKYKWFQTHQWELFATASIGYNRILHYENEMNTSIKMNDKTMVEFRATPPKINDINKNFMSVQAGVGFGFRFSENIQLAVSANYGKSLNSLRVAKSVSDPVTHLSQWNSQIGMNFKF